MNKHSKTLVPAPALVLHTGGRRVQTDIEARMHLAALARMGFERCPAPLVARPLDRSLRTVYGFGEPGMVGGLRAHDLLLCPRPFARVVLRGLSAVVDGPAVLDVPSPRTSLASVLARLASLLLVAAQEDPRDLNDDALKERLKTFDDNDDALKRARAPYDHEAHRRALAELPKGGA